MTWRLPAPPRTPCRDYALDHLLSESCNSQRQALSA